MKHYLHLWSLSALLVLTGCATTSPDQPPLDTPVPASQTHTPSYPKGPLSPIGAANVRRDNVANLAVPDDLWDRIRRGFAMPDLQNDLVRDR